VFGCVDPGNAPVPALDSVKRKIARVLEHLDPTRVLLAPDCGLMTISRALARDKLKVMVQAAKELRELKLSGRADHLPELGAFRTRFSSGVSPPLRLIQSFTGGG